jgi:hypothetical protein
MVFACKKCKKAFRKEAEEFEESDEYCPHCDNHFVIDALTPKPRLEVEGEDVRIDSRFEGHHYQSLKASRLTRQFRMLKDERLPEEKPRTIFDVKEAPNKLG